MIVGPDLVLRQIAIDCNPAEFDKLPCLVIHRPLDFEVMVEALLSKERLFTSKENTPRPPPLVPWDPPIRVLNVCPAWHRALV